MLDIIISVILNALSDKHLALVGMVVIVIMIIAYVVVLS